VTRNSRELTRAELRAKRRKTKTFIARLELGMIVGVLALVVVGGVVFYNQIPGVKASKAIAAGNEYADSADYEQAITSYASAIELDSTKVEAYSNMAGAYLSLDDTESAKTILYNGWENTQNESLLSNYYAVILNEAVSQINSGEGSMDTVASMVSVLSENPTSSDAIELISKAYSYAWDNSDDNGNDITFWDADDSFATYDEIMVSLMDTYEANPSEDIAALITEYIVPSKDSVYIKYEDVEEYALLLARVSSLGLSNDETTSLYNCFTDAENVLGIFSDIFSKVDAGDIDALRDFIVTDEFVSLRDVFLNNEETCQQNTTYIPVSREGIILERESGVWTYRFMDYEENPSTEGVLTLWANFLEDDGIQRNAISYEPGSTEDSYYPHTTYTVTYLYSNVTINGTLTPKMNYRLSTTVENSADESEETIIVDWGGDNESTMDTETIGKKMTP